MIFGRNIALDITLLTVLSEIPLSIAIVLKLDNHKSKSSDLT